MAKTRIPQFPTLVVAPLFLLVAGDRPVVAQEPFRSMRTLPSAVEKFEARDTSGRPWNLESLRGKIVLIDFWATWCAPCLAEFPYQRKAYERFHDQGFEILAVSIDAASRREVERVLRRKRLPWPQILDGQGYQGPLADSFGVQFIPASVLVGPEGEILALNLRGDRLLEFLETRFVGPIPKLEALSAASGGNPKLEALNPNRNFKSEAPN